MSRRVIAFARVLLLVAFMSASVGAVRADSAPAGPAPVTPSSQSALVSIDPATIDFGILAPGQTASKTVVVRSLVDRDLRIAKVTTCPCITVRVSNMSIPARGTVNLNATMEPKPGTGAKTERIRLAFEGEDLVVVIDVAGEVSLPVRAVPPAIDAREVLSGVVEVSSLDDALFTILATAGKPPVFVDFDPARQPPRNTYQLRWDLAGLDQQTMPSWWVIETDHPGAPIVDLRVMHEFTKTPRVPGRPWVPGDQRILVGNLRAGEPFDFTTKIKWPKGNPAVQTLQSVQSQSPQFTAEFIGAELAGEELTCAIRISVLPGPRGLIYGQMMYETPDGFSAPLTIIGRLLE